MNQGEKVGLGLAIFGLAVFMLGLRIGHVGTGAWGVLLMGSGLVLFCNDWRERS